ncbi:MAG TPA: amino acid permease [Burkholderiaceae bacterium]|jgi:GABA permease|nr:amino acid permease [Burkholderiaceae bacterium]
MPDRTQVELAHSLQPRHVTLIALGGIIGAGLFVGSSAAINMAGPAVLISYALSGVLVFLIMRMLGEMAVARPGIGTFAEYAALGLGPWAAFLTGWLYWYFWVITVGVETIAGATLLQHWVTAPVWAIGLVLIAAMTATNLLSVRTYGEFEFWFASLKVGAIAVFIVLGLGYVFAFGPGPADAIRQMTEHGGFFARGWSAPLVAIPVVIFSMMGSEVATIAAAETDEPARNVTRAARTVSLRILVFYVASIAIIVSLAPWDSVIPGDSPFTKSLEIMKIPGAAAAMSVIAVTAVLSCLNSGLYITSRMLHELARRGDAPAIFAATSARRVPRLGILFGTAAGFAAALASIISPNGVFLFLINTSGAIILFIYMIIAFGEIRFRQQLERHGQRLELRMWLFPWLSYGVIAGIAAVLVVMAFTPGQTVQLALSTLSVVVALLALGVRRIGARNAASVGGAG